MTAQHLLRGLALLSALALPAAEPAAVSAALQQPADAARYPQAGAVVLLDERVVTLDPQGRTTTEGHLLIKVLQDRAMRQLSDQRIAFRGDTQSCEVLVAATHLPGGATQAPEANGIMEVSDPEAAAAPFYSSARLKVVSFPGVQPGAVMELQYRVRPLPGVKADAGVEPFMGEALLGGTEPILRKTVTLRVPADAGLQYEMFNQAPQPTRRSTGASVEYTWTVADQPQLVHENGMVPEQEVVPRIVWTVAKDRAELGRWLQARFQSAGRPDASVRAKALELTAGLASPEAKAERLALFVIKEIQAVPLGLGRVGYQPTPAGIILANRYADTRDKFVLFQALLESAGLSAEPVFVHERRVRLSGLACLAEYESILARVTLPSGVAFYDLMERLGRLGQLTAASAGRPALLVGPGGGQAITTPMVDERSQYVRAGWDMALDAAGDLSGRVTLEYGGLFDHQVHRLRSAGPHQGAGGDPGAAHSRIRLPPGRHDDPEPARRADPPGRDPGPAGPAPGQASLPGCGHLRPGRHAVHQAARRLPHRLPAPRRRHPAGSLRLQDQQRPGKGRPGAEALGHLEGRRGPARGLPGLVARVRAHHPAGQCPGAAGTELEPTPWRRPCTPCG